MIMLLTEISINKHVCPPICLFTYLREKISPHLYPNYGNNMNGFVCLLLVWKASCFLLLFFFSTVELPCFLCDSGLYFADRCIGCSELTSGMNGCLCYMLALR